MVGHDYDRMERADEFLEANDQPQKQDRSPLKEFELNTDCS